MEIGNFIFDFSVLFIDNIKELNLPNKKYLLRREKCGEFQNMLLDNISKMSSDNLHNILKIKDDYKQCIQKLNNGLI